MLAIIGFFLVLHPIQGVPVEPTSVKDSRPLCPCAGQADSHVTTRVVGGRAVQKNSIPFASSIVYRSSEFMRESVIRPFCGGTLISDRHILTAAHCLRGHVARELAVDVGDYSLSDSSDGIVIQVQNLSVFPEYVPNKFHTDIGIIELKEPVQFHSGLQPARLPSPELLLHPGTTVYVFGWGRLSYDGGHPDKLHAVDLPIVDNAKCQSEFVSEIEDRMICAGGQEGKDACIGDSGSGLLIRLNNEIVLCGVVSFGRNCALPDVPGVYSKVSSFMNWILNHTRTSDCRPCVHGQD